MPRDQNRRALSMRKGSNELQGKSKLVKPSKSWKDWRCQMCWKVHPYECVYCIECYQELSYYFYIDMHMFVTSDQPFNTFSRQRCSASKSQDPQIELIQNQMKDYVKIDWIESLLD